MYCNYVWCIRLIKTGIGLTNFVWDSLPESETSPGTHRPKIVDGTLDDDDDDGQAWSAQLLSNHKIPSSIPRSAKI